ncbi:MAG: CPXCG motif-containing cysteine-rich protein [Methylovulum miyakonense]|uniref:CPXCG motif-containing cysteine-rich protein n=1 Tax=Methylovulum miyakonense TaxID=645578 RepID=UPI003BB64B33
MSFLEPVPIQCPYCGEEIGIMVDMSCARQDYIEDCQVCCKPMEISVSVENNEIVGLSARPDNG